MFHPTRTQRNANESHKELLRYHIWPIKSTGVENDNIEARVLAKGWRACEAPVPSRAGGQRVQGSAVKGGGGGHLGLGVGCLTRDTETFFKVPIV